MTKYAFALMLVGIGVLCPAIGAQQTNSSRSTGSCSPAISGNSNQLVINCNGLSAAKASQLVTLMNKLLAENLDLKAVTSKLDGIAAELREMHDTINPLANASPQVKALVEEGDSTARSCMLFVADWGKRQTAFASISDSQRMPKVEDDQAAATNARYAAHFLSVNMPKLEALDANLRRLVPDAMPRVSQPPITTPVQALGYVNSVNAVLMTAVSAQSQKNSESRAMVREGLDTVIEATTFIESWRAATRPQRSASSSSRSVMQARNEERVALDAEQTALYHRDLEPKLVVFRLHVQPLVPSYKSEKDYSAVTTSRDLTNVCIDVANLASSYEKAVTMSAASSGAGSTAPR